MTDVFKSLQLLRFCNLSLDQSQNNIFPQRNFTKRNSKNVSLIMSLESISLIKKKTNLSLH